MNNPADTNIPTDIPGTIGDFVADLWERADAAYPDVDNVLVVRSYTDHTEHEFVGTLSDLDSWDPFAADDGWPGPAVGGYSALVSPLMPVSELWRHLGRAAALNTYRIGDSYSISTR